MRFAIENHTQFSTPHLKKLCLAVAKKVGVSEYKEITIKHRFRFNGAKKTCWGYAFFPKRTGEEGHKVLMTVPKTDTFDSVDFASVLSHEFGHSLGQRHRVMQKIMSDAYQSKFEWAQKFQVPLKPPKVLADPTLIKLNKAEEHLEDWRSVKFRAENKIKSYQSTVTRLTKRAEKKGLM